MKKILHFPFIHTRSLRWIFFHFNFLIAFIFQLNSFFLFLFAAPWVYIRCRFALVPSFDVDFSYLDGLLLSLFSLVPIFSFIIIFVAISIIFT